MDRWQGKIAVVTGASSGIGAAIVLDLCRAGVVTIGLARRRDRIEALRQQLPASAAPLLHALRCDVSSESDICDTFRSIGERFGGIDILVNNAGVMHTDVELLQPDNGAAMRSTLDVNVLAPVLCTREAFKSMRGIGAGHVILMNSISGHWVPYAVGSVLGSLNVYEPSKHALTAMTEVLRQEFQAAGTRVKVSSISPGSVLTDLYTPAQAKCFEGKMLRAEDVSAAVMYVLGTPENVQVHELVIKPLGEEFL